MNNIVAARDKKPYLQLSTEAGLIVQVDVPQARQIAADIVQSMARAEADAMLLRFFSKLEFPTGASGALMNDFRDYRAELDAGDAERV